MLIFPAFILFEDVKDTYRNLGVSSVNDIPDVITHRNARLDSIYLKDALNVDYTSIMNKYEKLVLFIQGTNDNVVPYNFSKNISKEFKDVKFVTVENVGHFLDRRFNEISER
ncbi:alpha/beta hydrolase [Pseudostreptobacillus hongkongensis]|uniref:alpha/beta hydrolase n=1 Tax=Pseudostreptobacillus hongkongensis TaxID=1162717 RepID=UPI0028D48EF5|nr:alpha/beta hydrolase [Pseudostreptobacillus hongkongensis]